MDLSAKLGVRKGSLWVLLAANLFLLLLAWIMAFYSYPRLPHEMPLWLNFFGQEVMRVKKSQLFFSYPLAQSLFFIGFWLLSKVEFSKNRLFQSVAENLSERQNSLLSDLKKEFVYLALVFFNLIFIHIQRSLILVAHGVERGVSRFYFYSLFGFILIFIPFYWIRAKMLIKISAQNS